MGRLHHNKNRTSFPKKLNNEFQKRISHQFFCHNFFILMFHHVLNQGILSLINYTSAGSPVKMEENNELVFASFNQDTTSLAVGTTNGYKLYSLTSTDSLEPICSNGTEDVYIAERLFSSSLVAIVSQSAPRKLKVCHFKKGTEICNYSYTSKILAVKMNRARLVVCLEESFIQFVKHLQTKMDSVLFLLTLIIATWPIRDIPVWESCKYLTLCI